MEFKEFLELSKVYGTTFAFCGYFVWERILNPLIKKQKGTFVTWKAMKGKIDEYHEEVKIVHIEVSKLKTVMESQLEREIEKESRMKMFQEQQERLDKGFSEVSYVVRDIGTSLKTSNRLIGEVKDYLETLKSEPQK